MSQKRLRWAGKTRNIGYTDFVAKSKTTLDFLKEPDVLQTGLIVGGKTHNIAIQHVFEQRSNFDAFVGRI